MNPYSFGCTSTILLQHSMAYVQNEKDRGNAMRSFQWKRKQLENMLVLFNICATLWFFWRSSWFPLIAQAFWFSYAKLMVLFSNSFYTFLLLNVILLSLYALSNNTSQKVGGSGDFYNEFLNYSDDSCFKITDRTEKFSDSSDHKAFTCSEVGECSQVLDETVTAVTETTTTTTCCTTVSRKSTTTTTGEKVSEKKCYRKIRSENIERRVAVVPGQEFKRYNTTGFSRQRQLQGRLCYVEQLSKEEFNRAVEDFIAKHKRMQWKEQRESECLGLGRV